MFDAVNALAPLHDRRAARPLPTSRLATVSRPRRAHRATGRAALRAPAAPTTQPPAADRAICCPAWHGAPARGRARQPRRPRPPRRPALLTRRRRRPPVPPLAPLPALWATMDTTTGETTRRTEWRLRARPRPRRGPALELRHPGARSHGELAQRHRPRAAPRRRPVRHLRLRPVDLGHHDEHQRPGQVVAVIRYRGPDLHRPPAPPPPWR